MMNLVKNDVAYETYNISELMLHTKMFNVKTYVTHKYEMCCIRTNVTNENVIFPNVCYTRNMSCVRTLLDTKMCNVRTYVTHEYEVCSVRTNVTYENV